MTFLFSEFDLSEWACNYCINVEDDPGIRKYITLSFFAYWYCRDVKDRPKIRKYITDPEDCYLYNRYVNTIGKAPL